MRSPNLNRKLILAHPRSGSSYVTNLIHRYYDATYPHWNKWPAESIRIYGVDAWKDMLSSPVYAFKFFSFWQPEIDYPQLRELIQEHDIKVYALYRCNVQDTVVSQIVADRVGYLDRPPQQFPTTWELQNQIERVESYYRWFDVMCNELDDLILNTVTYESLVGDSMLDLRRFDIDSRQVPIHLQKVVNDSVKQDIIAQTGLNITTQYERTA